LSTVKGDPEDEIAAALVALDAVAALLADDDAVLRAGAAYLLGRAGQADPALATAVRSSLVAAAQDEIDDSVVRALAAAVSAAGLSVDEAVGLMQRGPTLRRIGVYHLAMVVTAGPEDEPVRQALVAAGDDPDPQVRWWARFGLDTAGVAPDPG
jgi:HEAT repeat protein